MANADYDEDLETNPFFVFFRRDFPDLFRQCLAEGLILAIPRRGSVAGIDSFDRDEFLRHILVASPAHALASATAAVNDVVDAKSDTVDVKSYDAVDDISTKLLFTETFYDDDMNKLQLWCVSDPFFKISSQNLTDRDPLNNPSVMLTDPASVKECVDFLTKFVGGRQLVSRIQQLGKDFEKSVRSSWQSEE